MTQILTFQELPELSFTTWFPWSDRAALPIGERPGLYLLARFETPPEGFADPSAREVIDIGETTRRAIRARLDYFHRAAFCGARGLHSAGETYRRLFPDRGENLFVAACSPEGLPNPALSLYIKYAERGFILQYALRWGACPLCNKA